MKWAVGDQTNSTGKGMMFYNSDTSMANVTDGTSNTIAIGEVRGYQPRCRNQMAEVADWRGMRWEISTSTMMPINGIQVNGGCTTGQSGTCNNCRL